MTDQSSEPAPSPEETQDTPRILSPEAQRALQEAQERRMAIDEKAHEIARQREIDGRGGKEPTRYDDWEIKGITVDF